MKQLGMRKSKIQLDITKIMLLAFLHTTIFSGLPTQAVSLTSTMPTATAQR